MRPRPLAALLAAVISVLATHALVRLTPAVADIDPAARVHVPVTTYDGTSQQPGLTASPATGVPGTPIVVDGTLPCCGYPASRSIVWEASGEVIGEARVGQDGTVTGQATIPLDAAEGTGYVSACGPEEGQGGCVRAAFDVSPPTIGADPTEIVAGSQLQISGEGWCCPGDTGTVTDLATYEEWATADVDPAGRLGAQVAVPAEAAIGPVDLEVCVPARCAVVTITVQPVRSETPSVPPGASTPTSPEPGSSQPTTVDTGSDASGVPPTDRDLGENGEEGEDDQLIADADGPLAALITLAIGVVLGLAARRLLRRRRLRTRPTHVQVRTDPRPPTVVGRDSPDVSISAVLDADDGTTDLRERQLR